MSKTFKKKNLEILDCTFRDGGYVNNWDFDRKLVRETYRALAKAGVDIIEVGYHGTAKYFDPEKYGLWRFSPESEIKKVVEGVSGPKTAIMLDYGKFDLDDILPKEESVVDILRLAVHKDKVKQAFAAAQSLKAKGYTVSLQLMGFSSYADSEVKEAICILQDGKLDYVYVADSYGSVFPNQMESFLSPIMGLKNVRKGFHPHNNLQTAFANTLEAMRCGVDVIDGSIFGMGRGAGNLPIEIILSYLELENPDKYNALPVLNIIDKYFINIFEQSPWGYQLPYMLSGIFKVHPSYVKDILSRHEYTLEDIWKVMSRIRNLNPVGYKKEILDDVLEKGIFNKVPAAPKQEKQGSSLAGPLSSVSSGQGKVKYLGRHVGRDFLVLANGPSLKKYQDAIEQFINKYDPVVLGANFLDALFVPHYHAFNNKRRFIDYVGAVSPNSGLLLSRYFDEAFIREYTIRDFDVLYYEDNLVRDFAIRDGVISANCRTISVLLSAAALVMGAQRVFIAGMDGYIDHSRDGAYHFYKEKDEAENFEDVKEKHNWNLNYLKQINDYMVNNGGEGLHILTPTNYKEFYKGIKNYI